MRFGLFYEHQIPRPWNEGAEGELLRNALEQIELADKVGFDFVWEVEHHFLEEYSHSSAPEVFLAAASQRTKNIRLGHGIVQLPPFFNHPARIAERVATLDLVSNGRVEFGTGESSSQMELGGFGIKREEKREQWEEALDAITRMFVEEPFAGYDGDFISMPVRNVVPKPQQKPHPPLWVACSRRETIFLAAQKGLGALSFSFVEPEDAKEWIDGYYSIIEGDEWVPAGFSANPNFAVTVPFMCHEDEETAIQRGIDGGHFFGYSLGHYYAYGEHVPGQTNVWDEFQEHRDKYGFARQVITAEGSTLGVKLLEQGLGSLRGAIGTPDQIAGLVERYEAAGADQIIFVAQAGTNQHQHICEAIELFGKSVLPRFKDKAEDRERAKLERLGPAIEAALARREPARTAPTDYVITSSGEDAPARSLMLGERKATTDSPQEQFLEALRGKTDDELNQMIKDSPILDLIFGAMPENFQPQYRRGFTGQIGYALETQEGTRYWTIHIEDDSAAVKEEKASNPAVTLSSDAIDFLRTVAGELNPVLATMEGRLKIDGDVTIAMRLGDMFGSSRF